MNRLLSIAQVKTVLNMDRKDNWTVLRFLRAVAEERCTDFKLVRIGQRFFVTEEHLRRLIPELYEHEEIDKASLRHLIQKQAVELREMRRRIEALENALSAARKHAS